jgi:hypothetical protein
MDVTPATDTPNAAAPVTDTPAPQNAGATEPPKTALTDAPKGVSDDQTQTNGDNPDKPMEGEGQTKEEGKPEGAPETYADFKLPENTEISKEAMGEFTELFKESNLTQDQAQKFIEKGAQAVQNAIDGFVNQWTEQAAQKVQSWHDTRAKDSEIGGNDEAQKKVLADASHVVKAIGGENLMKALDETGAGNHPEIIRAFFRMRPYIGEDGKFISGNAGGRQKSTAEVLYPSLANTNK